MAFEAEVWSTLETICLTNPAERIAGVVLNIAIIPHSRQWVMVCFRGKTGHDDCTAECLLLTQSGQALKILSPRNLIGWLQLMHSGIVLMAERPFTGPNCRGRSYEAAVRSPRAVALYKCVLEA